EDAVADFEGGGAVGNRFRHQLALDGAAFHRTAAGAVARIGLAIADALHRVAGARAPVAVGRFGLVGLRASPAGCRISVGEGAAGADIVEARGAVRVATVAEAGRA